MTYIIVLKQPISCVPCTVRDLGVNWSSTVAKLSCVASSGMETRRPEKEHFTSHTFIYSLPLNQFMYLLGFVRQFFCCLSGKQNNLWQFRRITLTDTVIIMFDRLLAYAFLCEMWQAITVDLFAHTCYIIVFYIPNTELRNIIVWENSVRYGKMDVGWEVTW